MAGKLRATSIQRLHNIFDFSPETLAKRPDVPQHELERMPDAARGIPEHVKKIGTKQNLDRMDSYVQQGLEAGSQGWYNTQQMREYFQAELGAEAGAQAYEKFIG